ncbi:hypothetical protein IH992_30120 [Candidatus Poribacteria bacterium]|nr:hypothetical protein [Candidatus Poribacteria bacterium]
MDTRGKKTDEKIKRLEKEWGIPIGPVTRKILEFQKKKWNYGDVIAYPDQKEEESEQRYRKRKEFEQWKKERLKALEVRQAEK